MKGLGARLVELIVQEMQSQRDPLATHIFIARQHYRNMRNTKSGKRHNRAALVSFQQAQDLGFRGHLADWETLLGAGA